ncbi:hypothetical protein LPJ66_008136 [Kickxella alabastrina]|uniref:Uncharacterized protein n=1 Tax=Kickxella alabastrina TaxID=61397 RepID=A0ACC1I8E0_9FUNG|nr:hypothetical protein LPJ66_008136 [Kickxella alabastrina]
MQPPPQQQQPPIMSQRPTNMGGPGEPYPQQMNHSAYVPPDMSVGGMTQSQYNPNRPAAAYNPPRPPSQYTARPPQSQYPHPQKRNKSGTHYGHLVSEKPDGNTPCSGDACNACCKYNVLACLFCCNGWMRLCGNGMSIKDILSHK